MTEHVVNPLTPDNGEQYVVELSNATLSNIKDFQAKNPDVALTTNRSDLETVMMGRATLVQQAAVLARRRSWVIQSRWGSSLA